jgi:6-phosphogluconate dehydrogenase
MQIGVIGLGRMGGNITRCLIENGHEAVVYDRDAKAVAALGRDGAVGAEGLDTFVRQLLTEDTIVELAKLLARDDIIIDGGNTF